MVTGLKDVTFHYAIGTAGSGWDWVQETSDDIGEGSLGAVRVHLGLAPEHYNYTIENIERTFMMVRKHPRG